MKEFLRTASESQSLFTRNWTDSFLLSLEKIASDEDELPSERHWHSDFLYSKNDQYKVVDLHFYERQHVKNIR